MTPRLGTRLLAALLPAAVLLPGAAHAERVVTDDAVGDVVTVESGLGFVDTGEEVRPAPEHESTDITRTVVDHRAGRLQVTVAFRDLHRSFSDTVLMQIRTPQRTWMVFAERRGNETVTQLFGRRSEPTCPRLRTTVDATTDRVVVRVPTSCIGDPRWVQPDLMALGTEVEHDPETGDQLVKFYDDAYGVGLGDTGESGSGPRVRRD